MLDAPTPERLRLDSYDYYMAIRKLCAGSFLARAWARIELKRISNETPFKSIAAACCDARLKYPEPTEYSPAMRQPGAAQ